MHGQRRPSPRALVNADTRRVPEGRRAESQATGPHGRPRSRVRRQHTAAKAYLRGFADGAGQFCMHTRKGTVERRNIKSATVERDFYTFVDDGGRPQDVVEHWLSEEVENRVAEVLRRLRSGEPLATTWVGILAPFVASSLLRTASVRAFMVQIDVGLRPLLVLHEFARRAGIELASLSDQERRRLLATATAALDRVPMDPAQQRRSLLRTMLRKVDECSGTLMSWSWEVASGTFPLSVIVIGVCAAQGRFSGWSGVLPKSVYRVGA